MDLDDDLVLSSHALAALQEFKKEENERIIKFQELYESSEKRFDKQENIQIDDFQEDWQLSQFWYSDTTASVIGRALLEGADEDTVIVVASAPSVFAAIKSFPAEQIPTQHIYLLDYDRRFELLAGKEHFYFYDYKTPDDIPEELRHKCHRFLVDPPFLEEECQSKTAQAAKNLLVKQKSGKTKFGDDKYKVIVSTGERMKDVINANYPETKVTDFIPEHKNGLSNEFLCYASFECQFWKFQS